MFASWPGFLIDDVCGQCAQTGSMVFNDGQDQTSLNKSVICVC